jgi:tetratricopeptide (TPR) repeat protein
MAKFYLRKIVSTLFPEQWLRYNLRNFWPLYNKRDYQEAYTILRDIMESQPGYSKVGNLYVLCADLELRVSEDAFKARQLLEKAQQLGCLDLARYYEVRGHVCWRIGEHDEGMQYFENSIALDPTVDKLTNLGRLLSSVYDKRAVSVWEQVLKKDPKNCLAHIYLGREATRSGDRDKALIMAKRAEKLDPSVEDFPELGQLYEDMKMLQNALNAYLEANRLGYKDKGLLYANIGACYLLLGDFGTATQYTKRAIKLGLNSEYLKAILLWSAEQTGAGPIVDSLVEKYRDTCLAFILLAQEAIRKKNFSEARKMIAKAEQLDPSPAEMHNIGRVYHDLRHWEKALNVYLDCERLGYDNKGLLYASIADCYCLLEDWDTAIQYASKSLAIDPGDEYAKDVLYACREATWGSEFGDNY